MYKILLERRAERDLDSIETSLRQRIVERTLLLKDNPRPRISKKLKGSKNAWRVRVGDWRILYEVDDKKKEIRIYRIRLRPKAY